MAQESILAVDIGADSIKIAEFSYPDVGAIQLEQFAFAEYGGDMSDDQILESLYNNFRALMEQNTFTANKVHLCISGQLSYVKFVKLPPIPDASKLNSIVEFEAQQNIPFPMDEVIWDYQLVNNEGADVEAMFVVIKKELIERITQIIELSGHQTVLVDSAVTAGYNAARLNGVGLEQSCMLLNIGGRCSTLMFIDGNNYFVRTIPIAGHYITEQIAKEFNVSYTDAEDMKRRHGFVSLGGAYEEPESEMAATISKIVRNAMTRLHGEINRSINVYRAQQGGRRPEHMYLAGGSSVMTYTPRFFEEKMRIPVEYLNPFQVVGIGPYVDRNALQDVAYLFSDVIGAGMRSAAQCPIEINLLPESLRKTHAMNAKRPFLFGAAIVLASSMLVAWGGTFIQSEAMTRIPEEYKNDIANVERIKSQINECQSNLSDVEAKIAKLMTRSEYHTAWLSIMNELQSILPDNAWISDLSFQEVYGTSLAENSSTTQYALNAKIYIHCTQYDPQGNMAANSIPERVKQNPNSVFSDAKTVNFTPYTRRQEGLPNNIAPMEAQFIFKAPKSNNNQSN